MDASSFVSMDRSRLPMTILPNSLLLRMNTDERIRGDVNGVCEEAEREEEFEDSRLQGEEVGAFWKSWLPHLGNKLMKYPPRREEEIIPKGVEGDNVSLFREHGMKGMRCFKENNLFETLNHFEKAFEANQKGKPQPFSQRGIILYIAGRFEEAERQLRQDIDILEKAKITKASDLRLWRFACLHRLGKGEDAIACLDYDNEDPSGLVEDKFLMKELIRYTFFLFIYCNDSSIEKLSTSGIILSSTHLSVIGNDTDYSLNFRYILFLFYSNCF